ncbi:hypothetical protein ACVWZR_007610 [Bradyrhizobium sp. i1.3.1]
MFSPWVQPETGHTKSPTRARPSRYETMHRTPIESRLARAGRRSDLRLLQDYARPPKPEPANDNLPSGYSADLRLEVRPSPDELLRLALQDAIVARPYGPVSLADIDRATRQRIRFKDGRIDQWLGGDGRWHSAEPHYRHERGKRPALRSTCRKMPPATWHYPPQASFRAPPTKALGGPAAIMRSCSGSACAGSTAAGLYPACRVTRHMVGIARGVQFMAGRVRRLCLKGELRRPRQRP